MGKRSIFIGFDERWVDAFAAARSSVTAHAPGIPVTGLVLPRLRAAGLYYRPTSARRTDSGAVQLWDDISDAPMATQFSISRFLTPHLAGSGWALFQDCDMLTRGDLVDLFDEVEGRFADKAIACVKHDFAPSDRSKMGGQAQVQYARKNWSSFMFFNVDHPANRRLTVELINSVPGRDLHRFSWIDDDDLVGELPAEWNWLVNHSDPAIEPRNVHFTDGVPSIAGYEAAPFADDWRATIYDWAQGQSPLTA